MAQKITTSYDWGNLPISVGEGTETNHVLNKGQVDTLVSTTETNANNYTDSKDSATRNYVDSKIEGLGEYVTTLNPNMGLPTVGTGAGGAIDKNDYWIFSEDGNILGEDVHKWEKLIANVSNATIDNDFRIEHAPHTDDTRHQFTGTLVPATVQEVLGSYTIGVTTPLQNADVLLLGGITITAGDNLDITVNTTNVQQATAIKDILVADNAFNAHYLVTDDLSGLLTISERVGQATGSDLAHNETGVVGGNVSYNLLANSVAYDLGDVIINHNLGYKYVQVIVAEDGTGGQVGVQAYFIDNDSLKLVNESDTPITVSGVISI